MKREMNLHYKFTFLFSIPQPGLLLFYWTFFLFNKVVGPTLTLTDLVSLHFLLGFSSTQHYFVPSGYDIFTDNNHILRPKIWRFCQDLRIINILKGIHSIGLISQIFSTFTMRRDAKRCEERRRLPVLFVR